MIFHLYNMWHSSLQHWGFASLLIKPEVVSTHVNAQVSYAAPASRIAEGLGFRTAPLYNVQTWGMDQYLLIPFLGKWTSIYQLFWCSPGVQGFDTLPWMNQTCTNMYILLYRQSESVGICRNQSDAGLRWLWRRSACGCSHRASTTSDTPRPVSPCRVVHPLDLCGSLWISCGFFCGRLGHTLGLFHSTAESCHHSYVLGQVSTSTWKKHGKKHTDQRRFRIGRMGRDANWTFTPGRSEWKSIGCSLPVDWLVVWNIFYFPFHVWDNPSHWLIFFKMVIAPPTRLDLH